MPQSDINQRYGTLKILWHTRKLEDLRDGKVSAPIYVRVKPTNRCNHHCFYCSYDPNAPTKNILSEMIDMKDEIPKEKMMEILSDFRDIGVKAVTYSGGGEPLIYPDITSVLERTLLHGIDLSIITNGQNLNGERADYLSQSKWTRISLDASDRNTFEQTRGVPARLFDILVKNMGDFAKKKIPQCEFGINFVVHHLNHASLYESARFFKELGVNHVKFTPRWLEHGWREYHKPFMESSIEQIKKAQQELQVRDPEKRFAVYDTYENDFSMTGVKERTYPHCYIMQTIPVIGADSTVYFCHDKTYTKSGTLGSIKDRSFKDLWFSKEAAEKFRQFDPRTECRQHCTYDSRNRLIHDAISCCGDDINFI